MKSLIKQVAFIPILLGLIGINNVFTQDKKAEDQILQAYEYRMSGDRNKAESLLWGVLAEDSSNHMAHFELSRTLNSQKKWDHIRKANEYNPDNPMYMFTRANMCMISTYSIMKNNKRSILKKRVKKCCSIFEQVLTIQPDCKETLIALVDIYSNMPAELGGNKDIAIKHLESLKELDPLYYHQGKLLVRNDSLSPSQYWKDYIKKHKKNTDALAMLCRAYLLENKIEEATKTIKKIIAKDKSGYELYLHVARAHLYGAMQNDGSNNEQLESIKTNINIYLKNENIKPARIEAWCYGWLGVVEGKQGNQQQSEFYLKKAEGIFPNYPKFTALPVIDGPPNETKYKYTSFFRPF
ncbi:hypothetical protein E9993_07970 [Labilibacter sediminis]|nr:hypothetical protein E9993_07970 [Labilibacter sediminis]